MRWGAMAAAQARDADVQSRYAAETAPFGSSHSSAADSADLIWSDRRKVIAPTEFDGIAARLAVL